jgi:hypothetical protein
MSQLFLACIGGVYGFALRVSFTLAAFYFAYFHSMFVSKSFFVLLIRRHMEVISVAFSPLVNLRMTNLVV